MRDIEKIVDYLAVNTLVFHGRKFEEAFAMAAELVPIYSNPIMFAHDLYGSHSGQNNSFF